MSLKAFSSIWTLKQPPLGCIFANRAQQVQTGQQHHLRSLGFVIRQGFYFSAVLQMSLLMALVAMSTALLTVNIFTHSLSAQAVVHAMACVAFQCQLIWGQSQPPLSPESEEKPTTQCRVCSAQRSTEHLRLQVSGGGEWYFIYSKRQAGASDQIFSLYAFKMCIT